MLSKILEKLRRRFANKSSGDLILENFHLFNDIAYYVGCNILTEDYSWLNVRLGIIAVDIVTYFMINFYSLNYFWGDLVSVAFCLVTLAMGFQGVIKILTFCRNKQFFNDFIHGNWLLYSTEFGNPKIARVQQTYATISSMITFVCQRLYCSCGALLFIYPTVATIFFERTLPFGFILPFIEPYGDPGFFLNYLHHSFQIFVCTIGVVASDAFFVGFIVLGLGSIEIIKCLLDELSEKSLKAAEDPVKTKELSKLLTDLIEMHQKVFQFMKSFQKIMEWHNFVQIGSLVFQCTVIMVVCSLSTWYPGYVFFVATYFQLFVACMFSNLLSVRFKLLVNDIYCSNWYLLPITDQKKILQLLIMAQKPFNMTYLLGNLNLETFVEVSKKVYQLFMLVQSFSEDIG